MKPETVNIDGVERVLNVKVAHELILRSPPLKPFHLQNPYQKSRYMSMMTDFANKLAGDDHNIFREYLVKRSRTFAPIYKKGFVNVKTSFFFF
jgi:hypothetical protein